MEGVRGGAGCGLPPLHGVAIRVAWKRTGPRSLRVTLDSSSRIRTGHQGGARLLKTEGQHRPRSLRVPGEVQPEDIMVWHPSRCVRNSTPDGRVFRVPATDGGSSHPASHGPLDSRIDP